LRSAAQEKSTGLGDRIAVLDENDFDEAQPAAVLPHTNVQLDRFQSGRTRQINGETRRVELRVVDRPFGRPAQQTADDMSTQRWPPAAPRNLGWHETVSVTKEVREVRRRGIVVGVG
jgi:hypothetical protein